MARISEIVPVAELALSLEYVRDAGDVLLGRRDGVGVRIPHGGEDRRLEGQAKDAGVQLGVVASD